MAMKLDAEQRRALNLLADAGPRGSTAAMLMAHDSSYEFLRCRKTSFVVSMKALSFGANAARFG
jgi:hypothetical protein